MNQKEMRLLQEIYDWFEDHVDGAPDAGPTARAANRFTLEMDEAFPWLSDCPVCGHERHPPTRTDPTGVCREWRSHTTGYLRECGCKGEA